MQSESPVTLNRELSWLNFNTRVLQEAADQNNPLVERMKFLGIFSNNLDEFFRVRVATLNRMIDLAKQTADQDLDSLKSIRDLVNARVYELQQQFQFYYKDIEKELKMKGIHIVDETEVPVQHHTFVQKYFREQVRPNLFPVMLKRMPGTSFMRDKSIFLVVDLRSSQKPGRDEYALIEIPTKAISRFLILPSIGNEKYIMILDDVIRFCMQEVFEVFSYDHFDAYTMKITRDAEMDLDNDISKSFLEIMTESLKQRRQGRPVRFVYDIKMPEAMLKALMKKLSLGKIDTVVPGGRYHNFKDFISFPNIGPPELETSPLPPLPHPLLPFHQSIFKVIRKKDILLFFPFQSFHPIIDLLREASIDPKVRSIKITLYRLARTSNVINALINASRNGKRVTVFMELQARFDERANIEFAEKLQREGVHIIQAIPGFKVHSKILLIRRREEQMLKSYGYIGTGNFNEQTAKVYSDCGMLTTNEDICRDIDNVFSLFEANYRQQRFKTLIVSPFNTRHWILRMFNRELRNAREGKDAWVIIKLNNLVDEQIVRKIYQAAREGVKVKLIIRGVCTVDPNTEGVNGNIESIGIVDRFLEHSRIIVFCHGGENLTYLTSADWMVRNLDNRIEVTTPVFDPDLKKIILDILTLQLKDNVKARYLTGKYQSDYKHNDDPPFRSQLVTYEYFQNMLNH